MPIPRELQKREEISEKESKMSKKKVMVFKREMGRWGGVGGKGRGRGRLVQEMKEKVS